MIDSDEGSHQRCHNDQHCYRYHPTDERYLGKAIVSRRTSHSHLEVIYPNPTLYMEVRYVQPL